MFNRTGHIRKTVVALAVLPLAGAGIVLTAPAASAADYTSKWCSTEKNGHDLDIKMWITHDDEDVDKVVVRATDDDEDGSWEDNHVYLRKLVVKYLDDDGDVIRTRTDDDSPYTISSDKDNVERIRVTATWRVHGENKTKTCTSRDLD